MSADVRCREVRRDLMSRLDDEPISIHPAALEQHLDNCTDCKTFEAKQHRIRRALRLAEVDEIPDVAVQVMAAVTREHATEVWRFRTRLAAVAAIATAMLILATNLPLLEPGPQVAGAATVTREVFSAARSLDAYRARFEITERGWHPEVPLRRFEAAVWYRSPERFRLRVRDLSTYPTGAWPSNDIDLIASPARAWIREPFSCPPDALPGCAIEAGMEERTLVRREPFDGTTLAPTDIVVPLEALATSEAFSVIGTDSVHDREALHVTLTYRQSSALVDALQAGGSWTEILPLDRVDLWLEQDSWFPLRFAVTRPGVEDPLLEVHATELTTSQAPAPTVFRAPVGGSVRNGGFTPDQPVTTNSSIPPAYTAGLPLYRSGSTADGRRVVTYAAGTAYVKVATDTSRSRRQPNDASEVVTVRPGSVGFYQPAEPTAPRRVDLFTKTSHVRVETNLRRADALRVAGSLRIRGIIPSRTSGQNVIRLTATEAAETDLIEHPSLLPPGYKPAGALLSRPDGKGDEATVIYLPAQAGLEGSEIRLFQSTRLSMLSPSSEDLFALRIHGSTARWSRERGELEWIGSDGTYRAITAPSFDLPTVKSIASSIR